MDNGKPTSNPIIYRAVLPGPDRKRTTKKYHYRLKYRNTSPSASGCLLLWDVLGGREKYQIAVERADNGELHCHCTCPDAVYRGDQPNHVCKHVQGFLQIGEQMKACA
jgi:hypothetical protein